MNESARESFVADFARGGAALPAWLQAGRQAALEAFRANGFPTLRQEEWKYTDVRPIASRRFRSAADREAGMSARAVVDAQRLDTGTGAELVFVDARYRAALSREAKPATGARARPLSSAIAETPDLLREHLTRYADVRRNGFVALNTALLGDGAVVHIEDEASVEAPIHLLFATGADAGPGVAAYPRNLIVLGRNARATIIENAPCWSTTGCSRKA
jgi:Fe-S cluster assembly protein SufD